MAHEGITSSEAAHVVELAAKQAVTADAQEQATFLLKTVGARTTTAAVGLRDARAVRGWTRGVAVKQDDVARRLQELYQAVWAIVEAFSPAVATAFLRGTNPHLGDRAPLVVLAEDPPEKAGPALLAAVRHLIDD